MILIAYDGTSCGRDAIAAAARLMPGPALVLNVLTHAPRAPLALDATMGAALDEEAWADRLRRMRAQADDVAAEGVRVARAAGLAAEPLVVEAEAGRIWKAIVDVADEHDVAAVVLGHRSCSGLHGALPGSVSRNVVAHSTRPVIVVPLDEDGRARHYTSQEALRAFDAVADTTRRPHDDAAERLAHQAAARRAASNPRRGVPG